MGFEVQVLETGKRKEPHRVPRSNAGPTGPCTQPITEQPYPHNLHQRIWRKSTRNLELRGSNPDNDNFDNQPPQ